MFRTYILHCHEYTMTKYAKMGEWYSKKGVREYDARLTCVPIDVEGLPADLARYHLTLYYAGRIGQMLGENEKQPILINRDEKTGDLYIHYKRTENAITLVKVNTYETEGKKVGNVEYDDDL